MQTIWNPSKKTVRILEDCLDRRKAFQVFRQSSSGYISKKWVRKIVISEDSVCSFCGTSENLQVDHVESVMSCFKKGDYYGCNVLSNLQPLCAKCNQSKKP